MRRLIFFILFIVSVYCMGKPYNIHSDDSLLFQKYLNTFEKTTLPFRMDTSRYALQILNDEKPVIQDDLKIFIPAELRKQYPNNIFRHLYLLPNNNDIIITLIFQAYMDEYENDIVNQYMVTYDTRGNVIDYQELAGYFIDAWNAFMSISNDYVIKRDFYKFMLDNDAEYSRYFLMEQTISEYRINESGYIIETKKITREGYFDEDLQRRYHLVKIKQ